MWPGVGHLPIVRRPDRSSGTGPCHDADVADTAEVSDAQEIPDTADVSPVMDGIEHFRGIGGLPTPDARATSIQACGGLGFPLGRIYHYHYHYQYHYHYHYHYLYH